MKALVLYQDEKHIWVDYPSFRIVCQDGEKPRIKANWDPHIRTSIFGSIDNEGKLINIEEDTANAVGYCKFMDKIVELCPEYQVFMMFVDRASYHRAKLVRKHIYELRTHAKNFKFVWLPRYSPELNPIEQLWKPFGTNVHNRVINAKNELVSVVKQKLEVVSQFAEGLMAKYSPIMFGWKKGEWLYTLFSLVIINFTLLIGIYFTTFINEWGYILIIIESIII